MPPVNGSSIKKQQSLEEISLLKEQKKIRDFFSKREEEKDGLVGGSNKLPLVSKNFRH